MIIELSGNELFQLFGKDVKVTGSIPLTLNGITFVLGGCDYWSDSNTRFGYKLYLQQIVKPKSPQEVAAEEAVQKLEVALDAAKDVLKTVKEK